MKYIRKLLDWVIGFRNIFSSVKENARSSEGNAMSEKNTIGYTIETVPKTIAFEDMNLLVDIVLNEKKQVWEVVVVISRAADLPPVSAESIEVEILGSDASPFICVDKPVGYLPEFGGSLGTSVNASFNFSLGSGMPKTITVFYQKNRAEFNLIEKQ